MARKILTGLTFADGTTQTTAASAPPDIPTKLYQGSLSNVAATVYTVPSAKQTRYESVRFVNNHTAAVTVTLYDGGTGATNTILPTTEIAVGEWIELDLSGMGQQATGTIAAVASVNSVITMTLYGSEESTTAVTKLYKKLYQGTPANAAATIITFAARTKVTHIRAVNTHATLTRGLGLYDGGTATTNALQLSAATASQIPAGGVMEIVSYYGFATSATLAAAAQGSGTDVVLTIYGIEG